MSAHDFLIEIGTEELPPKQLKKLISAFCFGVEEGLNRAELDFKTIKPFATPRRLALLIEGLSAAQPSRVVEKRGPAVLAAFSENKKPTQAATGFAKSCGTEVDKLKTIKTEKGEYLFFKQKVVGKKTTVLLPDIIQAALKKLPVAKLMRWADHNTEFVRPVKWVCAIYNNKPLKIKVLDKTASNITYGHRFHAPKAITLKNPNDYEKKLEKAFVIADYEKRKQKIRQKIKAITKNTGEVFFDEGLLDEITGLTEWPVALLGEFDKRFLNVPCEALISAMKTHQKCLPVYNKKQKLLPFYVTLSNIESKNKKRVIEGNNRVMRARLSDAEFFYQTDCKTPLSAFALTLKKVVFQSQLGTLQDKAERVASLCLHISEQLKLDAKNAKQAGLLAKADLMTEMVGEFPELQGTMGYYYALKSGLSNDLAQAIKTQYHPRFAKDTVPETHLGCTLALADKIDTLVGIFGINQIPTGDKDPFALRRAALGVLRIIIEGQYTLDLKKLLEFAEKQYKKSLENKNTAQDTLTFIMERLRAWYIDQNIDVNVFLAVLARHPTQPYDFHKRVLAVQHFLSLPEARALAAANKRVSNILKKQPITGRLNEALFEHGCEKTLAAKLIQKESSITPLYKKGDYVKALSSLASLRQPLDDFFDNVMVMTDDEATKNNRLVLLNHVRELFLHVADISILQ